MAQRMLYEVEEIIDQGIFNGQVLYLVKWLNFTREQSTWQPKASLGNVQHLISAFNTNRKQRNCEDSHDCDDQIRRKGIKKYNKLKKITFEAEDDNDKIQDKYLINKQERSNLEFCQNHQNSQKKDNSNTKNNNKHPIQIIDIDNIQGYHLQQLKQQIKGPSQIPLIHRLDINQNSMLTIEQQRKQIKHMLKSLNIPNIKLNRTFSDFHADSKYKQNSKQNISTSVESITNIQDSDCNKQIPTPTQTIQKIFILEMNQHKQMIYLIQYSNSQILKCGTQQLISKHPTQFVYFLESILASKMKE